MKHKKLCAVLALLLAAVLLFSGCASHGPTLIEAGKEEISLYVFQLYLSRMKGSLASAGYSVGEETFWKSYISADNTTMADYYTLQVFEGLKHIAAAMVIYDELGLSLPKETKEEIDAWIDTLIAEDGEGSKASLNSILAQYGANITALRDAALIEAKLNQLKEYYYGADGSLIADTAIEEYYKKTYYRGYQMLLANYYYERVVDADGFAIRYETEEYLKVKYQDISNLPTEEQGKYKWVPRKDLDQKDYGKEFGEFVLFYIDGETKVVAYATDGVIQYILKNGQKIEKKYSEEQMTARYEKALAIAAECRNNPEMFLQYAFEFSDNSEYHTNSAPNGMYFSVGTYTTDTIYGKFSAELAMLDVGGTCVLPSDSGYFILMRVDLDTGAWQNTGNSYWFSTLRGMTLEYMLQQRTSQYLDKVTVDEELFKSVDITMVGTNMRY